MCNLNAIGMKMRGFLFAASLWFVTLIAHAFDVPPGWSMREENGVQVFVPGDLQEGEIFEVRIFPRASMAGAELEAWLKQQGGRDKPSEGKWTGELSTKLPDGNIAAGTRGWVDAKGRNGAAVYSAVSVDKMNGRIARILLNESPAVKRHQKAATELAGQLGAQEMRSAKTEDRATDVEAQPPAVDNIKAGGPLQPGRYVGNLSNDKREVLRRFDVLLFANGEYQFLEGGSKHTPTGKYTYRETTGKLDIQDPLWNSKYEPDEDFCVYGKNAKGEYVIYAEDYYGVGTFRVTLTRVGDVDRAPPTQAKKKREQEEAEAARYKYVTAPGKGLGAKDIEAIVYRWEQIYEIGGLQLHDYAYLLLMDGTVYQGLPVPPEDMDVAASKKNESKSWGRWRKSGGNYEVAWADAPHKFEPLKQANVVVPAKPNERAQGTWTGASSYSMPGGAGSWLNWGITLTADGRFEKFRSGGAGSGQMGELSGTKVTTGAVFDDEGSVSVVSGPNIGGGSQSKSEKTKADRSGTYALNGYTLELRYDNGAIVRLPFFWSDAKRDMVWFEGSLLSTPKDKK